MRELDLVDADDNGSHDLSLLIRRVVATTGRGRVYINGRLTTVGTLKRVTSGLVDISSQHQHTQLLDTRTHLALLDRFGGLRGARLEFQAAYRRWRQAITTRDNLQAREADRLQREDFVRFQLQEIDEIGPTVGEDDALRIERDRLAHAERLVGGTREAAGWLRHSQGNADHALRQAGRLVEQLAQLDATLTPLSERLETARIELEDVAYELEAYRDQVDQDAGRLDQVQTRLQALKRLARKHGGDLAGVVAAKAALTDELDAFASLQQAIDDADVAVSAAEEQAWRLARELGEGRTRAALDLAVQVRQQMASLAMPGADLRFSLAARDTLGPEGAQAGEILVQTNAGEGFAPLAGVASGGELSRVLLSIKRAFMHVDPVGTVIFDEIDSGTGGAVADAIGVKLAEIGRERQVMVITHLAQIAARGQHHIKVEKSTEAQRTTTQVRCLTADQRSKEIARMLGGVEITERVRAVADELLAQSK